ncbi:MAG: response regulator transcription factor, partial [Deltaproteobacteria bacterium]|nr:response regulator transcription factor [Deltaproteobacteria bacterium]
MQVLLIEDNPQMSALMQKGFQEQGYNADATALGHAGEETAFGKPYDVIILDRMLPDRDGIEVCRSLRRRGITTPILMLTALSDTEDKIAGLDAGADDYLAKPFAFEELLARIRALLRRGEPIESTRLTYDALEINLAKHTVTRDGQPINLTNREFSLLEFLVRRKERVVSRTAIGEHVWDMNYEPSSNVIDVYVSMLRRKVDKGFPKPLIHTVI